MFSNPQRVAVFRCLKEDHNQTETQMEADLQRATSYAYSMYDWLTCFYHNDDETSVEEPIVDFLYFTDLRYTKHPWYGTSTINEWASQHPDLSWSHSHLIGGRRESGEGNVGGYGGIGGSMTFDLFGTYAYTSAMHEACGHGQGVGHMGRLSENGSVIEYGGYGISDNTTDSLPGSAAYDSRRMFPQENMKVVNEGDSDSVLLYPVEAHPLEVGQYHQLLKMIDNQSNRFYVSLRRSGVPFNASPGGKVLRMECRYNNPPDPGRTKWIHLGDLREGETTTMGPFTVRYVSDEANRASLIVETTGVTVPSPLVSAIIPTTEYEPLDNSVPLRRENTGLWKHDDFTGQGYDVFINEEEDYCVVGWYTYGGGSIDQEQHRWNVMQGPIEDGIAKLDAYRSTGSSLEHRGTAKMELLDDGRIFLQWNLDFSHRCSIVLSKLGQTPEFDDLTGWWKDTEAEYQGLKIMSYGDSYIGYWFGYGPSIRPGNPFAQPNPLSVQRWYMIDGDTSSGEGTTYSVLGRYMRPRYTIEEIGSTRIYREGDNLVYEMHDGTVKTLTKLFG